MSNEETERVFRPSLRIYASILIIAGIGHAAWYWFFPTYEEMIGLSDIQWSTFNLFNWSVSILLIFLSMLSYAVSWTKVFTLKHLRTYSFLTVGFWICRLALEIIFPVQIPFIVLPNPSMVLKMLMILAIVILAMPELQLRISKENEKG